ncbi:MAG: TonB-dependent receptor [Acidobacteria bacterium]|nr:TonB-dependent receptor [Acidobacteriota bacterium]
MIRRFVCLLVLAVALLSAPAANAQVLYGSIVGNVKDATEAAAAGTTVTVINKETNQSRQTTTDEVGSYSFPTLQPGTYDIRVGKEGFSTFTKQDVVVTLNSITRVDVTLKVGAITESVTVAAEVAALQTDRSEVRAEIVSREIVNLPVPLGRNYQQLFRTLPGFAPPANAHSIPTNPSRSLAFNVNGTSRSSNNTRLDGASSTTIQLPHITAYVPSLEAIETVNVVTNSFDAEQGLAGGAAVNVQTRSGTNDFHGAVFEYNTVQALKAKPFFLPQGQRKPKWVYNQFGAAAGGPIKKDKVFYFLAWEGTYDRQNASRFATVPTAAMRAGDMSASPRPVYDPRTGDESGSNRVEFPNKQVPASRFSSISRKLADLTPLPNLDLLTNNFFNADSFIFDRHTADTKLNYNINEKLNMFLRFSVLRYAGVNKQIFGDLGGPPIGPAIGTGNPGFSDGGTYSATVGVNYVVTPSFIIDAYYGYTRMDTSSAQPRLDEKLGLDFLKIPGTNGPRFFEGGWPRFSVDSFTNIGINEDYMPYYRRDPQYQYVANFNWTRGKHELRFGVDLYRQHLNQNQVEFVGGAFHGGQGGFTFSGGPTTTRGGLSANQFNSYATFLLGLPTQVGKILQVPDEFNLRASLDSLYLRDRWNVTPRLTLNYGLRWEYFPFPTRADRGLERYDPDTNKVYVCGVGSVPKDCGMEVSKRRFAPRVGLAYRATSTFVVRAGYGITNDPFIGSELLRAEYPVLIPLNLEGINSFQPYGRLEDGIPTIRVPDLGNGIIDIPGTYGFGGWPQKVERGYVQSWNLTLQKQLPGNFTAEAGYVATRQVRQLGYLDINSGQVIGAGQAGRPLRQKFGRTAATTFVVPLGTGRYDSLQARLNRRFSRGLELSAHYTWSKAIGWIDNSDSTPPVKAVQYFNMNRTVRGYDRPQNLQIISMWELPFGKGRQWLSSRGVASSIVGGWQVNNIWSFYSGAPFTPSSSGTSLDLPGSSQKADQVKPEVKKLGGAGRGQSYFDPFAFAPVTQPRFGTAGFNSLRGPGIVNWDFGVFREFAVKERWKIQFRMESFNFSNTPHFGNPGTNVSNLSLNPDGTIRDLGGYTEITGVTNLSREGVDERQFRFGLRISF